MSAVADMDARHFVLFNDNCVQCHAEPKTGAPLIGRADDWRSRVVQGENAMLLNVVQGIAGMPPLGYCSACDESDFRAMIRFMVPADTMSESGQ